MLFWIFALLMTVAAILCVLIPLGRRSADQNESANAITFYKDQLAEADKGSEAVSENERAEIARRLLKEARQAQLTGAAKPSKKQERIAAAAALVFLPAIAFPMYLSLGSPSMPDAPLSGRETVSLTDRSVDEMVQMAEKHLAKNRDDVRGWSVLADVYGRMNRPRDRAQALQNLIRIQGEDANRLADLGEALAVADGNIVSAEARQHFEKAVERDPKQTKARVYLTIAMEQDGLFEKALANWNALAKERKSDQSWQNMVSERIALLQKKAGESGPLKTDLKGPDEKDIEAASELSAEDRQTMIRSMVSSLADRLETDPKNLEGWKRLIKSYSVLDDKPAALAALKKAKGHFQQVAESVAELDALQKELGLTKGEKE